MLLWLITKTIYTQIHTTVSSQVLIHTSKWTGAMLGEPNWDTVAHDSNTGSLWTMSLPASTFQHSERLLGYTQSTIGHFPTDTVGVCVCGDRNKLQLNRQLLLMLRADPAANTCGFNMQLGRNITWHISVRLSHNGSPPGDH